MAIKTLLEMGFEHFYNMVYWKWETDEVVGITPLGKLQSYDTFAAVFVESKLEWDGYRMPTLSELPESTRW